MMIKRLKLFAALVLLCCSVCGCTIKYSFTGASIDTNMKTVTVNYFQNQATNVSAILASTFNDQLQQKIQRETRLQLVPDNGDGVFEGEITNYFTEPAAISGEEYASKNRLVIEVRVKYTDNINPKNNFDKTFRNYEDYDSNQMLNSVEGTLVPQIVTKLIQDIFNAAYSNW